MSDVGAALVGSDLGSIPSAVATLLAFAAFVAPGFLLRAGYVKSRVRGKSQADLYILAEAVVGSLAVLAALWWWRGRDVLTWAQSGTLVDHENKTYWFFIAVLVGPYVVGVVAGWLVNTASNAYDGLRPPPSADPRSWRRRIYYYLDQSGIFTLPTIWDQAWNQTQRCSPLIVRVRTSSGSEIAGSFERGAWVGMSPDPYDIYLRRVYRENQPGVWEPIPDSEGVVIREGSIESVEFLWADSPDGGAWQVGWPWRRASASDDRSAEPVAKPESGAELAAAESSSSTPELTSKPPQDHHT